MQGTLQEIDLRSILQLIELGQRTGELSIEAYSSNGSSFNSDWETHHAAKREVAARQQWLLFFANGRLAYGVEGSEDLLRLQGYLHRYGTADALELTKSASNAIIEPEYGNLWLLLEKKILTPPQGRNIIESALMEVLFDLLSLRRGYFTFATGTAFAPLMTTFPISALLTKAIAQVQQWKQFYPHLQSPHQCFAINNEAKLKAALPPQAYQNLSRWADGKTSLRQLSRYLNRDLLTLAKGIYPYAQRGWIHLVDAPSRQQSSSSSEELKAEGDRPHIVCIDDDLAVTQKVESILTEAGYRFSAINDPFEALGSIFQLKPDLILGNLALPNSNSYEICAMLRRSEAFGQTPIIVLTDKESFRDRVKIRLAGATDCLTKPIAEGELLLLVEKYLHVEKCLK
jgi:twitching motility two-component system response regulator PilG